MLRVGFEPTILVFERAKTFPTLDRSVNVIGVLDLIILIILSGVVVCCVTYKTGFRLDLLTPY
jgi:hypothetical protein